MDECARLAPVFAGICHERLDREGALHWPCRSPETPASTNSTSTASPPQQPRAPAANPYLPPGEPADQDYPFTLITGRRLEHYNAGTMTRRTDNLLLVDRELLEIHPDDADRLGITDDAPVEVTSRRGTIQLTAELTDTVNAGQLFMAFHFPEAPTNALTSNAVDEVTGCPEYKITAVTLHPTTPPQPTRPSSSSGIPS